jgi:Flp pilus assembly protein TadB
MPSNQKDYYKVLQVDPAADPDIIAVAYKRLARKYHPDTNPSPEATRRMQAINTAYQILRDPGTRAQYDRERSARASWSAPRDAEAPRPHEESDAARRRASEDAEAARQRRTPTPGMVTKWLVTRLVPVGLVLFLLGPLAVRLVLLLGESPLLLVGVVVVLWLLRQSTRKQRHPHRPPRD